MCSYLSFEGLIVFAVNLFRIRHGYNKNDPAVGTKKIEGQKLFNCVIR